MNTPAPRRRPSHNGPPLFEAVPILVAVVCFATAVWLFSWTRRRSAIDQAPPAPAPAAETNDVSTSQAAPKPFVVPRAITQPPPATAERRVPKVEYPFVAAEELLQRLNEMRAVTNALTLPQIELISQTLKQLVAQGDSSIPAIAAWLDKNEDIFLQSHGFIAHPTLRASLMQALFDIGSPDATALLAATIPVVADPYEIGLLATLLEQRAPGQYRAEVIDAATESLAMARRGELEGRDVGPIFQALQTAANPDAKARIETSGSGWDYYSVMSLAALPDGSGISSLVQRVQDPAGSETSETRFTWQILAQYSGQSAEAQSALLTAAREGRIPANAWPKIVTGLTGDQYMFGDPRTGGPRLPDMAGLKTYHIRASNQNYFSLPLSSVNPPDIAARRSVLDALLANQLPEEARGLLREARNSLGTLSTAR